MPKFAHLKFTEPCISFEFLARRNDTVRFSVNLDYELKPNFNICQLGFEDNDWHIVFEIDKSGFDNVLIGLKDAINKFPFKSFKKNKKYHEPRYCLQLSRHSSMDAGIQLHGCVQAYAILGCWIAAIPAAMT